MAEPLKNLYNPIFFEELCPVLRQHIPEFDSTRFIHRIFDTEWPELELKQRVRKVATVLHLFLPADFKKASTYLTEISNSLRQKNGTEISFPYIFLADYIELFGQEHFSEAMRAIQEVTQLISAEFAIRPFIVRYPDKTMKQMLLWSKHQSHHVRRLSSEGCRPRLPWAMALPEFKKDPSIILPILENLKTDSSLFVRKSVANNLNDISKDHPHIVLAIAKRWKGLSKETDWILKHGSRTLLKNGSREALTFHGFNSELKSVIKKLNIVSKKVKIGASTSFSFEIASGEKKPSMFRLEYAIHFITSSGKVSRKVFQIAEKVIVPNQPTTFSRKHRFTDFTTRKHFPGKHVLEIIVNGESKAEVKFDLVR